MNRIGNTSRLASRVATALLVAALLVAAACGGGSTGSPTEKKSSASRPSGPEVYFPRQKPAEGFLSASVSIKGELILDKDGCLRVRSKAGRPPAPIWPHDYSANAKGGGVRVLDGKGKTAARVGDQVEVGGSGVQGSLEGYETISKSLQRELPERCQGPYQIAGPPIRKLPEN